jgi:hypothetical protein
VEDGVREDETLRRSAEGERIQRCAVQMVLLIVVGVGVW